MTGGGFPKYGDYNGNTCAAGRAYFAWASATSPPRIAPPSTDIDVFFDVVHVLAPRARPGGPYFADEGVDLRLHSASSDPNADTLRFEWQFGSAPPFVGSSTPLFTDVGQDKVVPVTLTVSDPSGLKDVDRTTITVRNVAPTISLRADTPVNEGSPARVTGVVTDRGWQDSLTGTINWGDGSPESVLDGPRENVRPNATLSFDATHVYGDDGIVTVRVCARDDDSTTCEPRGIRIDNVAPSVTVGTDADTFEGDTVNLLPATFVDPGVRDTHTATIDWGDGSPVEPGIVSRTVSGGTVTGSHVYDTAGVFTVTVAVRDDDAGLGTGTMRVRVAPGFFRFCLFGERPELSGAVISSQARVDCGIGAHGSVSVTQAEVLGDVMSLGGSVVLAFGGSGDGSGHRKRKRAAAARLGARRKRGRRSGRLGVVVVDD